MEKTKTSKRTGLHHVLIELTSNCNLRCGHCYSAFEKKKIIDTSAVKDLAIRLEEMN